MRKIIANALEPLSTIVAITAVLGLRIGETLALLTLPGGLGDVAWFKDPDGNVLSVTNA